MKGNSSYKMSKTAKRFMATLTQEQRAVYKLLTVDAEMTQKFAPKPRFAKESKADDKAS